MLHASLFLVDVNRRRQVGGEGLGRWGAGECHCNTTQLVTSILAQIPRGLPGRKGSSGRIGVSGAPGTSGQPGPPGERGPRGEKGERGERGYPGKTGPEGPQGAKGESGADGLPGAMGKPGPQGPPGQPGWGGSGFDLENGMSVAPARPGTPGPPGVEGSPGAPGERGPRGHSGSKGDKGDDGRKGEKGDVGPAGHRGLQGPKGEPGAPGLNGAPGPPGSFAGPGSKGDKGTKGSAGMGLPGPPGMPGKLSDRDRSDIVKQLVEDLENKNLVGVGHAGDGINIWDTRGESDDEELGHSEGSGGVLYFPFHPKEGRSVRGPTGPPGPRGPQGIEGIQGLMGPPGETGPPGQPGLDGLNGQKGEAGEPGTPGMKGATGAQGPAGEKGERGTPGLPGQVATLVHPDGSNATVIKGDKGDRGRRGRRGRRGPRGPPGPTGELGLPGWPGTPGRPGPPGAPGMGLKGEPGSPGPPGPPGPPHSGLLNGILGGSSSDVANTRPPREGSPGPTGPQGPPGLPGPPGPPGPAGPAGSPGAAPSEKPDTFIPVPGPPGLPGPPGPPGPQGSPGSTVEVPSGTQHAPGHSPAFEQRGGGSYGGIDELRRITGHRGNRDRGPSGQAGPGVGPAVVPGAVIFPSRVDMFRNTEMSPVGTLAFLLDEEAVLVRIGIGWQHLVLGAVLTLPTTTPAPPTTPVLHTTVQLPHAPGTPSLQVHSLHNSVDGPRLRLAALNQPYTGDMRGVTGVDYTCYREARRAGLSGTFRAFLTSRIQNLDSIVQRSDASLPVVNIKGEVLFNSWRGIFSGDGGHFIQKPRIFSFDGKELLSSPEWPQKYIWHGSDLKGGRALSSFCDAWHSNSREVVGLASSLLDNRLLAQEKLGCHNSFAVLCIEATSHAYKTSNGRRRRHTGIGGGRSSEHQQEFELNEDEYYEVLSTLHLPDGEV